MYPADYRYTNDHEWIRVEGATGIIGITDYAQQQLGDVVFVELPKVGAQLKAGASFGTIESVKAVSDLLSPASGEVIEVNASLGSAPEKVNQDPHGAAWLLKIRLADPAQISNLMDASSYDKYIAEKTEEAPA